MGHYKVVRRLASGGMAEVFLGKVVGAGGFEKPVAIKRMLPQIAADPASAEAFLREARLCVHLCHPNVVQVLDLGTCGGQPYLVMELVDGEDLRKVLVAAHRAGARLTAGEAIYIGACVAEALAHAHEAPGPDGQPLRVVHRDVNPTNVIISMRGEVKLVDFGVARAADGKESTEVGLLKGKLGYLAPEIVLGGEPKHASDIFLAGVLLYELLAGRPLFGPQASMTKSLAAVTRHDESTVELPPHAPAGLKPILRRALARDPSKRHPTGRELADDLRGVLADHQLRVGCADLARRMSGLFPNRTPLTRDLGRGVPLREDPREAPTPAGQPAPSPGFASGRTPPPRLVAAAPPLPPITPRTPPRFAAPAVQIRVPTREPERVVSAALQPRRKLGELMLDAGVISEAQLENVLARQRRDGGRLGEWIVGMELAPSRTVLAALARQLGVRFISDEKLLEVQPDPALIARFPHEVAVRLQTLPLREKDGTVTVVMTEPTDLAKVDMVRFRLGSRIAPILCSEAALRRALLRVYGMGDASDSWRGVDVEIVGGRVIDFEAEAELEDLEPLPVTPPPMHAHPAPAPGPYPGMHPVYGPPAAYAPGPGYPGPYMYVVPGAPGAFAWPAPVEAPPPAPRPPPNTVRVNGPPAMPPEAAAAAPSTPPATVEPEAHAARYPTQAAPGQGGSPDAPAGGHPG